MYGSADRLSEPGPSGGSTVPPRAIQRKSVNSLGQFVNSYTRAQAFLSVDLGNKPQETFDGKVIRRYSASAGEDGIVIAPLPEPNTLPATEECALESSSSVSESQEALNPGFGPTETTTLLEDGDVISYIQDESTILVQRVQKTDGSVTELRVGKSTEPQTIVNSINVLVGIGIFALPLGFKICGWIVGTILLLLSAIATAHTAELLGKCLKKIPTASTYSDLAVHAFGPSSYSFITLLFCFDLVGAGVSAFILFGDSLNSIKPVFTVTEYKLVLWAITLPLSFLPLNVLSCASFLGIVCNFIILFSIFLCGLVKPDAPGSLISIMPTTWLPGSPRLIPLSLGIFMAPWGGHAVFPDIYRDMRHPAKFNRAVRVTFASTFTIDMFMGVLGFLMFGVLVDGEVTKSILSTKGYPSWIYTSISALMALLSISKVPLVIRPIVQVVERPLLLWIDRGNGPPKFLIKLVNIISRIGVVGFLFSVSVLVPSFEQAMAFLGAGICYMICITLPLMFYLSICRDEQSFIHRLSCQIGVVLALSLGSLGVIAAFLS